MAMITEIGDPDYFLSFSQTINPGDSFQGKLYDTDYGDKVGLFLETGLTYIVTLSGPDALSCFLQFATYGGASPSDATRGVNTPSAQSAISSPTRSAACFRST